MATIKEINEFIEDKFDMYEIPIREYFEREGDYDYNSFTDEQVNRVEVFRNNTIDAESVQKISTIFGVTKDDIINLNSEAFDRWYHKFTCFRLIKEYDKLACEKVHEGIITAEDRLMTAIVGQKQDEKVIKPKYDIKNLKARLIAKLKELDESLPGTYHENSKILKSKICH